MTFDEFHQVRLSANAPRQTPSSPARARLAAFCLSLALCALPVVAQAKPPISAQTLAQTTPAGPVQSEARPATAEPSLPAAPPTSEAAPAPAASPAEPDASAAAPSASAPAVPVEPMPAAAQPTPRTEASLPSALPQDLSPWGMFLHAVLAVKVVMVGLAIASLVTWTIWLAKTIEIWSARKSVRRDFAILANASSLREAQREFSDSRSPVAQLVSAALAEEERSDRLHSEGVKERASILLSRIEAQAGRTIARGTAVLASIGSTAPFVGLFGTVWGIMDSFIGISRSHTTNLAVVAPGIAEALLATALGLVAAIPAVVIYNMFARSIAGYKARLSDAAAEVLRHLSRDLDRLEVQQRRIEEASMVAMRHSAE